METTLKLDKTTISILKHFGGLATSIHIQPSDPQTLIVSSDTKQIVALARNVQSFDDSLAIYNITNFVACLDLFKDAEFDLEIFKDRVEIKSSDGVFNQNFNLSDPSILLVPKPEKTEVYFTNEIPIEFDLSDNFISKLKSGIAQNNASTLLFETVDEQFVVRAANCSTDGRIEKTTNQFSVKTGFKSDMKFRVGIPAGLFSKIAAGSYKVGITKNYVRFLAPAEAFVSYVFPSSKFSTVE
jgi:hypothetical protein